MNPTEVQYQDADAEVPPAWALAYADTALRCGMKTPEIEAILIGKGLPPSIAESVVPYCFEKRLHEAKRSADRRRLLSRTASLVIAAVYLLLAGFARGPEGILRLVLFLLTPLGCIWFPEIFGTFFRRIWLIGPYITNPTPAAWVVFGGWFLLLIPILYGIVFFIMIAK
jgi:hypothetical protein